VAVQGTAGDHAPQPPRLLRPGVCPPPPARVVHAWLTCIPGVQFKGLHAHKLGQLRGPVEKQLKEAVKIAKWCAGLVACAVALV
jgi:hypothetical protein